MDVLLGLILFSIPLLILVVLPILTWRRVTRAERAAEGLKRRIELLEAQLGNLRSTVPPPVAADATPAVVMVPIPAPSVGEPDPVVEQPVAAAAESVRVETKSSKAATSIEAQIGARWLLYFGVAAIVLGASYFLKYAFDNEWITETGRVLIGGAIGGVIIYTGLRFIRSGYAFYGQILTGGGVAVLYLAAYAAYTYYHLVGQPTAFGAMVGITALGAVLADRERSEGLALFAVAGGFMTPALVGGETDAQIVLFTYVAVLVAGIVYLAHRRAWPWLHLVSLAFTVVILGSWAERFYTADKYLTTQIFLTIFCAMFVAIARANRRSTHPAAPQIGLLLNGVPALYHATSVVVLFEHSLALLVYLIAVSLVAMLVVGRGGPAGLRLLLWAAVTLPFFGWLSDHRGEMWRGPAAVTLLALYGMQLLTQLDAALRERSTPSRAEVVLIHANGLGLFGAGYWLIEAWYLAAGPAWAAALALWNGLLAAYLWKRSHPSALHFLALGSALAAIAVSLQFDGAWITIGWAAEGAALLWLAVRERRGWLRAGAVLLLAFATLRVLSLQASSTPAGYVIGFNSRVGSGLAVIALLYFAAYVRKRGKDPGNRAGGVEVAALVIAANILTLTMFSAEIDAYWNLRSPEDGRALGREVLLSVTWAAYAVALIIEGIRRRYAPIRYLAIAVLGGTILKIFIVDLAALDRVYRILSVVIVGMLLLLASYLYQRYSQSIADETEPEPEPHT